MNWLDWLHRRGITDESIERFHLSYDPDQDAIQIPYLTAGGWISQVRYRRLGEGHPKYLGAAGAKAGLYNVSDANASPVYICEGEFDVVVLVQAGFQAVGVPGASSFQAPWRWLFMGAEVHLVFDGDDAGRKGAMKVARELNHVAEEVIIHDVPDGEDVSSLYLSGSLEGVLK